MPRTKGDVGQPSVESTYGPGWYDVWEALGHLEKASLWEVDVVLSRSTSVDGRWGLYVAFKLRDAGTIIGACGYGKAYPNGAKTFSAAIYAAYIAAERWLIDEGFHKDYPWLDDPK